MIKSKHDLDKISPWNLFSYFRTAEKPRKPNQEDLEYMHDLGEALQAQATPASSALIYLIAVVTISAITWASIAEVDEVTQASARVIPVNREQIISSLEGGILSEMLVKEGDVVEVDQPLMKLDPTRFKSQYAEGMSRIMSLKAAKARAHAEASNSSLIFPDELKNYPNLTQSERESYHAKKKTLDEATSQLKKNLELLTNEIAMSQELANKGLFSIAELSRLKRQANELNQQISERKNRYMAEANTELARLEGELNQLNVNVDARLDVYQRTVIRSPTKGVVKNVRMNTTGSAVPPSAPILEIIPIETVLIFEAKLNPKDISHIHPGLPVAISLAAYDSAIYGELQGEVQLVSPDTFREDARSPESQEGSYYRVLIKSEIDKTNPKQKSMEIIPGMNANAQIKTGKKTILRYLTKPLLKAKEAFRER
jgi:membrane fusion protein, adhesin transport system